MRIILFRALLALLITMTLAAWADVKPAAIFTDGMVLQRDGAAPVWGTAAPGEAIAVAFRGKTVQAVAAGDGAWTAKVATGDAGGPFELAIAGKTTVVLHDVLVGEVWLCSGQSNMVVPLLEASNAAEAIPAANDAQLRLFTVPQPDKPWGAPWQACTPDTARTFSAAGYFFGRDLRAFLKCPVGLILSAQSGSKADAWTSTAGFENNPATKQVLLDYRKHLSDLEESKKPGSLVKAPGRFRAPPATLYDPMIAPIRPYGMRGVIWYQGESVTAHAPYRDIFAGLIKDWRAQWAQGDFPFLFVQIAPVGQPQRLPVESGNAATREAQLQVAQTTPNTAMVVTTDVGNVSVHPPRKEPVGQRLALAARALAYGQKNLEYNGPIYAAQRIEGARIILSFTHVDAGLVAHGGPLTGFTIAGEDLAFVSATAELKGNEVVVSAPIVPKPAFVRFGWADSPVVNLFNGEGLPAAPFRTDTKVLPEPVR